MYQKKILSQKESQRTDIYTVWSALISLPKRNLYPLGLRYYSINYFTAITIYTVK